MKILDRDELKIPEDLTVTAEFVRHGGKLYKKGETIPRVAGNDKAVLVATKKAVITGGEQEDDKSQKGKKGKGKGKEEDE